MSIDAKKESLKTLLSEVKQWKRDDVRKKNGVKQQEQSQVQQQDQVHDQTQQQDVVKKLIQRLLK